MREVDSPRDQYLIQLLSHGRLRYSEVESFLAEDSRWGKQALAKRLSELPEEYEFVAKEEQGRKTFYYRTDIKSGRVIRRPKIDAHIDEIKQQLYAIELRLGIQNDAPIDDVSKLPDTLHRLYSYTSTYKNVLATDELLERFFAIVDVYLEKIKTAYRSESGNYPTVPIESTTLLLLLLKSLQMDWSRGREHIEFDSYLRERAETLVNLVEYVPAETGLMIRDVLMRIAEKKEYWIRESFKRMVTSRTYDVETLIHHAEYTYRAYNALDKMQEDLIGLETQTDAKTKETITEVKTELRRRLRDASRQ